jgi:predicted RNase H-like nuclease (RuvC/YqgF family)
MSGASVMVSISIVLFVVNLGLVIYFFIVLPKEIERSSRIIEFQKRQISRLDEDIRKKYAQLREISSKATKARKKLKSDTEIKKLKKELKSKDQEIQELNAKIKKLKSKKKVEKIKVTITRETDWQSKIKQKYPNFPKNQLERIEIERSIARSLMKNNSGAFHVSQIIQSVENLYPKNIKPNDRITLLNEIKSWVERDPLCKSIKSKDSISKFTFI